jgi:hypothetical protein
MPSKLKKPTSPSKSVKAPKTASKRAATTRSVLDHAAQAGKENQLGTKRTTGKD